MSNLRELLNPEKPDNSSSQQNIADTPSASTSSTPVTENVDHNRSLALDSLTDFNSSFPANHGPNPSLAEDTGHPPHENCPDSLDCLPDTNDRPQHTLPVILRCAILGSAKKKLTIRDIYAAMEEKYPYYRTAGPAWKQSVRHHLSLSRLFERKAKPVTEPGFGSYWTVNLDAPPGTKRPRKRGRQNKGADSNQSGTPSATETIAGRRGRPKKYPPHDFEFEGTSGLPSTSSGHTSSARSIAQTTSGGFATYHLPVNGCSSQQFRLHSIHDIPSTRLDDDDDDDEKMIDIHDDYAEGRSQALSDDVDDSTDDHSVGPSTISCFSGDPRTVPPPSFSSLPVDPTLIINYSGSEQHISRLKDEVDELQGRITSLLTEKSRMERELSEARAEIARLRARSEASE